MSPKVPIRFWNSSIVDSGRISVFYEIIFFFVKLLFSAKSPKITDGLTSKAYYGDQMDHDKGIINIYG